MHDMNFVQTKQYHSSYPINYTPVEQGTQPSTLDHTQIEQYDKCRYYQHRHNAQLPADLAIKFGLRQVTPAEFAEY